MEGDARSDYGANDTTGSRANCARDPIGRKLSGVRDPVGAETIRRPGDWQAWGSPIAPSLPPPPAADRGDRIVRPALGAPSACPVLALPRDEAREFRQPERWCSGGARWRSWCVRA